MGTGVGVNGGSRVGVGVGITVGPGVGGGKPSCTVTEAPGSTSTAVPRLVIVRLASLSGKFSMPEIELVTGDTLTMAPLGATSHEISGQGYFNGTLNHL